MCFQPNLHECNHSRCFVSKILSACCIWHRKAVQMCRTPWLLHPKSSGQFGHHASECAVAPTARSNQEVTISWAAAELVWPWVAWVKKWAGREDAPPSWKGKDYWAQSSLCLSLGCMKKFAYVMCSGEICWLKEYIVSRKNGIIRNWLFGQIWWHWEQFTNQKAEMSWNKVVYVY